MTDETIRYSIETPEDCNELYDAYVDLFISDETIDREHSSYNSDIAVENALFLSWEDYIAPLASEDEKDPWPDPPSWLLKDPKFDAVWDCIKSWDINVPEAYDGYCGATGNHVYAILRALDPDLEEDT